MNYNIELTWDNMGMQKVEWDYTTPSLWVVLLNDIITANLSSYNVRG
jgi:hypothetical protein